MHERNLRQRLALRGLVLRPLKLEPCFVHVVALTRWGFRETGYRTRERRSPESEAEHLAPLLGVAPYDLRIALSGVLPLVILRTTDAERAYAVCAELRARDHGAVQCDTTRLPELRSVKRFRFGPEAFVVEHPGPVWELSYEQIAALVCARFSYNEERQVRSRVGRMPWVTFPVEGQLQRNASDWIEQAMFVFDVSGGGALLREPELSYTGLATRAATSHDNFELTKRALRACAPRALYDEHLLAQRRATAPVRVTSGSDGLAIAASNVGETELFANLIALAHAQAQL